MAACAVAAVPAGAATPAWPRFAPYVDQAGWPPPNLTAIRAGSGAPGLTLGFVVAQDTTKCLPSWGGYATYPAQGAKAYRLAQVRALRRAGGVPIPSFGGQAGAELATVCPSAEALAAAYGAVLDSYGADHADFDIEGAAETDAKANARRGAAIALLQRRAAARGRPLRVALTLPVLPTGLDSGGRAVLRTTRAAGARVDLVNVMAMDYGDSAAPRPSGRMGAYAIRAGEATRRQIGDAALGVTPMLGVNDVSTEVFDLTDAAQLAAWARRTHVGLLSMWEAGRDRPCKTPTTSTQIDCSSVTQSPWAFSRALASVAG